MTLADITSTAQLPPAERALLDQAVRGLGEGSTALLEPLDRDARAALVSRLISALRALGARDLPRLEAQLMRAVNVMPRGERSVSLHEAQAASAVQKLARYFSVCIGMDWAQAAAFSSSLDLFCRELSEKGGQEVRMQMTGLSRLSVQLSVDLGFDLVLLAIESREPWTAPLRETATIARFARSSDGGVLEYIFDAVRP